MNRLASRGQLRASLLRWSLLCIPGVMLLGFLSGAVGGDASSPWFQALEKPGIYPPPATFGIVWSVLYALIGFALALVASAWGARGRGAALIAFAVQLVLNLVWSPLFFGAHQITAAFYLLLVLDVAAIVAAVLMWRVRWQAGALMVPYIAWILFATALNYQFMTLNPDADGARDSGATQRIEFQ